VWTREAIVERLHRGVDPYADVVVDQCELLSETPGWGNVADFFERHVVQRDTKLIVEVGSWYGRSAIAMSAVLDRLGMPTPIICVDTWLGSPEMWLDRKAADRWPMMHVQHGYPTFYREFLKYTKYFEAHRRVVPFPMDSMGAARVLDTLGIRPTHVFLDGNHYGEAFELDLKVWGRRPVVLFGDDYDGEGWEDIAPAVHGFAKRRGRNLFTQGRYWLIV